MTTAKLKRGKASSKPSARPSRARARKPSAASRALARLPIKPKTVERVASWAIFLAFLGGLYAIAEVSGTNARAYDAVAAGVANMGFKVDRIEVVGVNRLDQMKVYEVALAQKNRSMIAIDLDDIRARLLKFGWIGEARVSRRLPDTLVIEIVERKPSAVWQNQQKLALIDQEGVVLEQITPAQMPDLPLLIGGNANQQTKALKTLMTAAPSLDPLIVGATWVGNRRWDLRFQSGETLSLPEGDQEAANALKTFTRLESANRLLGRGILRFDMRDPSKFVLRLPEKAPDGTATHLAAGKGAVKPAPAPANKPITTAAED